MDDFSLGQPVPPPLQMEQPRQKNDKREMLKLALLMSVAAAKGGPGATQGALQGWQQGVDHRRQIAMQDQQLARQSQMDAMAQQRFDAEQQYRGAQLADRDLQRKQDFLNRFQTGLGTLDDPESVQAYLKLHQGQSGSFGVDPTELETYAQTLMPPSKLQKKSAEAYVGKLKATYGNEWAEKASQFGTHVVKGESLPLEEVLRRAELPGVPRPVAQAPEQATPGSFEEYVNLPPDQQRVRQQQRREFLQADDRPLQPRSTQDPEIVELNKNILRARLENLQTPKDTTGLPPRISRQVEAQARGFDSQGVVKRTQVMADAVSFVDAMNPNTQNPADDQALIYAFAKIMDPDSVVREGEYATVQKYAQSWLDNFGFNVQRVLSNQEFLTPQARSNMKATIKARYAPALRQYLNVRRSYVDRINRLTGQGDGDAYLIDYGGAFPSAQGVSPASAPAAPPILDTATPVGNPADPLGIL